MVPLDPSTTNHGVESCCGESAHVFRAAFSTAASFNAGDVKHDTKAVACAAVNPAEVAQASYDATLELCVTSKHSIAWRCGEERSVSWLWCVGDFEAVRASTYQGKPCSYCHYSLASRTPRSSCRRPPVSRAATESDL